MESSKRLQYLLISFVLCFGNSGNYAQETMNLPEGSICNNDQDKSSDHICRKMNDCPSALEDLRKNILPNVCSLNSVDGIDNPIVCCRQVKTYSAAEKCLEYSEFIYTKKKRPEASGQNTTIKVKDCFQRPLTASTNDAVPKEFPHLALLGFHEKMDSHRKMWDCVGSLISLEWVLTNAYCVEMWRKRTSRFVRLGQLNFEEPSDGNQQDFEIIERVVHPKYQRSIKHYDIALVRLDRKIIPTPFVRPVCLHTEKTITSSNVVGTGWWITSVGESQSPQLQKINLNIKSATQCNFTSYEMSKSIAKGILDESMICAGVNKTDTGVCDNGPIQIPHPNKNYDCMYSQVGFTSFGTALCGIDDTPSVYTRVSAYIPWIELIVWPKA